jgi:hypothetical protein
MKVLSKVHMLAERNGWSIARAQGFIDGEMSRRRGVMPSTYAQVGIDDYCLGFRAGYYERGTSQPHSVAPQARRGDDRPRLARGADHVDHRLAARRADDALDAAQVVPIAGDRQ